MIEVEILNRDTVEVRYVEGKAGDTLEILGCERVVDYWPKGVLKEGDPLEYLEQRRPVLKVARMK